MATTQTQPNLEQLHLEMESITLGVIAVKRQPTTEHFQEAKAAADRLPQLLRDFEAAHNDETTNKAKYSPEGDWMLKFGG